MKVAERAQKIKSLLDKNYPMASCTLNHKNVWELLCATVLSAQCTDARVNLVTPFLFKRYKNPKALSLAPQEDIEEIIRSCGFYHSKAKNLKGIAIAISRDYNGKVPAEMEELLKLPGVARKTANVVLSTGYGKNEGFVVDTHVTRLSQRLGLTKQTEPSEIEKVLMRLFPRASWGALSHQLIAHGRAVCTAHNPKCKICPCREVCGSAKKLSEKE